MTPPIALQDWPRLLTLVEQALDLPPDERETWLRSLQLAPALEAALRGLLAERRQIETGEFLQVLPAIAAEAGPARIPTALSPDALIGPWRLLREAGQGGMSTVWLAERADGQLRRQVALKLPHAGPGQDMLARRLLRERRILAALEHPHIARLYDVGVTETGTPYLVMEWVQGCNLLAYADARRLNTAQRVALFQQVLQAVQHAHGKLVLHRDLKPGNILVSDEGQVKLLDFGIAKPLGGDDDFDPTELTRAGGRVMTLRYASPEQLLGQPLDVASDVYALGVLLYELLCGLQPHDGGRPGDGTLERAILQGDVTAPSRRELKPEVAAPRAASVPQLRRHLAGELDAIVLRAMALQRHQRYASAEALAADLGRWQTGDPVLARLPGPLSRTWKFCRRHPWGSSLGTAAVAALSLATAVALLQAQQARSEAARARAASDFMQRLFEDTDPDKHGGKAYTLAELLDRGRARLMADAAAPVALQDELLAGIAKAQSEIGEFEAADQSLQQWVALCRQRCDPERLGWALVLRAENDLKRGRFKGAADGLAEAGTLWASRLPSPALAAKQAEIQGWMDHYESRLEAAAAAFKRGLALLPPADPGSADQRFALHLAQAQNESERSDAARADAALLAAEKAGATLFKSRPLLVHDLNLTRIVVHDALGLYHRVGLEGPGDLLACRHDLGSGSQICRKMQTRLFAAHWWRGDAVQAAATWPDREKLSDRSLPERQRLSALRDALRLTRLAADAALERQLSVELIHLEQNAKSPMDKARASLLLAEVALLAGRLEVAARWLERAETHAAQSTPDTVLAAQQALLQGLLHLMSKRPEQAEPLLTQAYESFAGIYGRAHPVTTWLGLNRAQAWAASGRRQQALELVQGAWPHLAQSLGANAPALRKVRELLRDLESAQSVQKQSIQGFH